MHSPTVYMAGIGHISLRRATVILAKLFPAPVSQKEQREWQRDRYPDFT